METGLAAIVMAGLAGLALPIGGVLARLEHLSSQELRGAVLAGVTAFGGGALLSAVALVLVPRGAESLSPSAALALLALGGLCFFQVDRWLDRSGSSAAMLLAMLLDFLPEAMALGAMLATEATTAKLLALMIFLQNLPEGFAAFREVWRGDDLSGRHLLLGFLALAGLGPLCALGGVFFLSDTPAILGGVMIFAAGGILYLLFQDVAPAAHRSTSAVPALGAVAGFALGLAGSLLIG